MKIKANRNFYKNVLIAFASLLIFMGSFGYFLGFEVNVNSLMYYALFLVSTILLFLVVFLIIDISNKKYFVFDDGKIIEKNKHNERLIVCYNQILYTKYHNSIDLFYPNIDFGYAEIVYFDSKDRETKSIHIYLSKKNYKKIFGNLIYNK